MVEVKLVRYSLWEGEIACSIRAYHKRKLYKKQFFFLFILRQNGKFEVILILNT